MHQSLDFTKIYADLQEQFYVNVPFNIPRSDLEEAIQAFFKFLAEPDSIKTHIDFSIAPLHRRGDVGFRHRDPSEDIYNDSKDFFHYHPALFEKYPDFLEKNPVVANFVHKAKPIWDNVYQSIQNILKLFEPKFPGAYNKIFDTEHVHILLRFLKYNWNKSEKYLAKPHFDAGSFTLAIAESCSGLRIGNSPENLKLVEHKADNAIFMVSSNFQKVINTDTLAPSWHDVIQLDETFIGKPFARWAIVAFIEAHGVKARPRTETHKWYTKADYCPMSEKESNVL